jgi:formylglycine-generating enzyme required for sulfatase activity
MPEKRKLLVFLCHSSQDKAVVRELYRRLLTEDWIDPWLDEEKILPGHEKELEIEKAVEDADAVIVCLSKNSEKEEGDFQKELRKVLEVSNKKPPGTIFVIPLRLDDCSIPRQLNKLEFVDFFPKDSQEWAYQRILASLKLRGKEFLQFIPEVHRTVYSKRVDVEFTTLGQLEYTKVGSGIFFMGSSIRDDYSSEYEMPFYESNLAYDYWIGRYPVTNLQYATFAKDTGISFSIPKGKEIHPVVYVSWIDALEYVRWLNKKYRKELDRGYRFALPSELEWEKAARGPDGRLYPWGKTFDTPYDLGIDLGRDRCNIDESGRGGTVAVTENSPSGDSPYGAANMAGNVWEWTRSLWSHDKEAPEPEYQYPYLPNDGREEETVDGARVLRGGSFFNSRWQARCAVRGWDTPDARYRYLGFRIAVVPSA